MRLREHTHTCCMIMFGIIQATDEETETDREKKNDAPTGEHEKQKDR